LIGVLREGRREHFHKLASAVIVEDSENRESDRFI
jgi:hypothetical protein